MVQLRHDLRFQQKPLRQAGHGLDTGQQLLVGHFAPQVAILGELDFAHGAGVDPAQETVMGRRGIRRGGGKTKTADRREVAGISEYGRLLVGRRG